MSCGVYGLPLPSLKPCEFNAGALSIAGPSPNTFHGRVPKMLSLFTAIHAAMSLMIFSSLSSIVPSPRTGTLNSKLPFLLTMSASIWMTVLALL